MAKDGKRKVVWKVTPQKLWLMVLTLALPSVISVGVFFYQLEIDKLKDDNQRLKDNSCFEYYDKVPAMISGFKKDLSDLEKKLAKEREETVQDKKRITELEIQIEQLKFIIERAEKHHQEFVSSMKQQNELASWLGRIDSLKGVQPKSPKKVFSGTVSYSNGIVCSNSFVTLLGDNDAIPVDNEIANIGIECVLYATSNPITPEYFSILTATFTDSNGKFHLELPWTSYFSTDSIFILACVGNTPGKVIGLPADDFTDSEFQIEV